MARISVIIGIYNCAPTLVEALDSLYAQTYQDFKVILCEDGSSDNTYEVAAQYAALHDNIILIRNEKNMGLNHTLNRCLELADTEYVARMDGDDIAEPFWLEKEVALLDANPEIGICSGGFERFGTVKSLVRFPERPEDGLANMLFECTVMVPTFRMSLYRDYGFDRSGRTQAVTCH